ncbi:hypothetical protein SAMN06265348_101401 [Pedobacter westerhofensis]|uniref:DUF3352 domain-containing protein n=1 Tax=Pedobacter westerhofensis TaxID=425512 RepID=A0A521AT68_9SPHI|nr:hypothetical protein [Pedobacter westerhofensis]SMO38004.1 hypothetical protein SAMN06265348_101401 [Pedobacter westerhofensis]
MKRIYLTLIILLAAMSGMAYLYFSRLNRESTYNEVSLHAATANSGLVFCIHNDKSIFEILKGQDLFEKVLGESRFNQLSLLKDLLISNTAVNSLIANRDVFISFSGGKTREINYLISTQLNGEPGKPVITDALQSAGIKVTEAAGMIKLTLNDSTVFYLGLDKNLVLLADKPELVQSGLSQSPSKSSEDFVKYIKLNSKLGKNSVGNLFIDFNKIPPLLKSMMPGNLNGSTALFNHQDSFAALNYNFSRERLFFSGSTRLNAAGNYLSLYAATAPQKNSMDNLLPANTANFRLYAIPDYKLWHKSLNSWFSLHKEDQLVRKNIQHTDQLYHLNPDDIFPRYFKDQLITFQLRSSENLGAINLSNGDKVKQLLIDISTDYDSDIKLFKVADLLYGYFGEPFKKFSRPYYTIIDNYLVVANQPATLQEFLSYYRRNELLVSTPDYIDLYAQISNTASVTFYANHKNSADIVRNSIFSSYYKHFAADKGLGKFSSMIYQLNGGQGDFQTNFLINRLAENDNKSITDSLSIIR